ncbi:MAG: glycosyltransferase family 39 protein [Flavobacteriales bacterium]|nr:glycosyltransferase family 39 protein [Flavobacteriales bacterium]
MATEQPHWRKRLEEAAALRIPGGPVHRWALLSLLLLASALRLWDLPHIPFTHDEISALLRVRFSSFSELIAKGVAIDAHPSGVQVFEWIWTGLFGTSGSVVKLPFIVMGVAALFFLYRFAAAWTSPAAALLSMAFIGTVQYTVMYAQIARPYAAGFFTCALLMDQITRALGGRKWAWAGVAMSAALCAYVHHFALLFALLAGLCLLFLAAPLQRKRVLLAGGLALLLYLPELPITWRQLGYGGVGQWLSPPTPSWLPGHAAWIFQYSIPLAVVVTGIALLGWAQAFRSKTEGASPFIPLCLVLGLVPLVVGYGYSVLHAPVLQYSVVLFSFPFLVFPLFAGWRSPSTALLLPLVALIAATSVFGLVEQRKHYEIFYRSKYEASVRGIIAASKRPDRMALVDLPEEIPGFYFKQWHVDSASAPYINLHERTSQFVDSLLSATSAAEIFYGASAGADPENLVRIQQAFPFMVERHDMEEGQTFLFSGMPNGTHLDDRSHVSVVTPEALKGEGWNVDADLPLSRDTSGAYGSAPKGWDVAGREFGAVFERAVFELSSADNDILEARMDVMSAAPGSELKLVMELKEGDRSTFYRTSGDGPELGRSSLFTAIPLSDLPEHGHGARLRVYLWNPGGKAAQVSSIAVHVREGNPWLYGLFQPLKGPLRFP